MGTAAPHWKPQCPRGPGGPVSEASRKSNRHKQESREDARSFQRRRRSPHPSAQPLVGNCLPLTLRSSPRSAPAILPPSSSRPPLGPPGLPPGFHPLPRQGGDSRLEGRASLRWGQDSLRQAWEKRVSRSCFLSHYVTTEGSKEVREPGVQRDRRSPEPSQSVRLRTAATAGASFK